MRRHGIFIPLFSLVIVTVTLWQGPLSALDFDEHSIDADFQGVSCVFIFDLDRDGDQDIIGGSEWTPYSESIGLAWWRNDGGDPISWTKYTIDASFDNVMSVEVAYVNPDTFPDIIASSWNEHKVKYWKNSGDPTIFWTNKTIISSFTNAHDAEAGDFNKDGHTDVACINSTTGSVVVCYNNGSIIPAWTYQTLSSSFTNGKTIEVLDLDGDGDEDIIETAADLGRIAWWENGGGDPVSWTYHPITSSMAGACSLDIVHMNGDTLYDIISASYTNDEVSCFICNDLATDDWTKQLVTGLLSVADNSLGNDFDRDGDVDIVAIGLDPGQLVLFENDNLSFTGTSLKYPYEGGWALGCGDINGDGKTDFVSGAAALGTLSWWENTTVITGIDSPPALQAFLLRNYPNPFNPVTTISFTLPAGSYVELSVFDAQGRRVKELLSGRLDEGPHRIVWDGTGSGGKPSGSGVYLCRLKIDGEILTRKMVLLK